MARVTSLARPPALLVDRPPGRLMVLAGGAIALAIGLAAGNPTLATLAAAGMIATLSLVVASLARPMLAYQVVAASLVMLLVVDVLPGRGLNLVDLLVPTLLLATMATGARGAAFAERQSLMTLPGAGPRHAAIWASAEGLARAVVIFYGVAVLSLGTMIISGRAGAVVDSLFSIIRACEGLLVFPLGLWWMRSARDVRNLMNAMLVGAAVFVVVNMLAVLGAGAKRAGVVWYVAEPFPSIASPNEAATAMIFVIVVLLVRQSLRYQVRNLLGIGVALAMIVLTASRSGLLALLAFGLVALPRLRWTWFVGAVALLLAVVPFVPSEYWSRLARTLLLERGSFESFTALVRFQSWQSAWSAFLDHPILGIGYLSLASVSSRYNDLQLVLVTAENYYLEIAAGMGIVGLVALAFVLVRLFRLGHTVAAEAAPGTLGHAFARFHVPLLIALLVACLTGDNLVGMVGLGQVALWCAMLVRAGHLSVRAGSE